VVASLLVTYEWSDWRAGWFWWIQSVFVVESSRGRGVYRALYEEVLGRARGRADVAGVRLYVELENVHAQAVYERLGMRRAHYHLYEVDFVLGE
jgi:ribosomal protein S18 acetylase RimI-like enzyme